MSANLVLTAEIKVEGSAIAAAAYDDLLSTKVESSLWMPARATLRFRDPGFALTDAATFGVGKALTVSMPSSTGSVVEVFSGEITDVTVEVTSGVYELRVGALDKSHRLSLATNIKSYANQTYQSIVQAVVSGSGAGLTSSVTISGSAIPYVLQTTSDYAFLWDIALRTGCEWWIDGTTLHFEKRASTTGQTVTYGTDLNDFRVRYSGASHANKVTVQGWDSGTQAPITGDDTGVLTSSTVPGIGATSTFATGGRTGAATWGKAVVTGGYAIADATEASAVADALAARVDAAEVLAEGSCYINPAIKVGQMLTVANMGTAVSGDYLVTSVEHVVSQARVETRFTAGNKAPVGLADLVGAGAPTGAPRWGSLGLVIGTVESVTGDPDSYGRVRVKFPSLSSTDTSAWARVMAPGAGPDRGVHYNPEINDEVLIGFEHGDHRFPIVLGGVWSKVNKPPVATAADPVVSRLVKTRLGHLFEMSDGDADTAKHISMTLADGANKFRLGADKTDLEIASGKVFTIKSGSAKIVIDAQGGITIEGGAVKITATQDLTLKGMNVKINADMGVTIAAGTELKASGSMGATVDGGAMATIKGGMVKIN